MSIKKPKFKIGDHIKYCVNTALYTGTIADIFRGPRNGINYVITPTRNPVIRPEGSVQPLIK